MRYIFQDSVSGGKPGLRVLCEFREKLRNHVVTEKYGNWSVTKLESENFHQEIGLV